MDTRCDPSNLPDPNPVRDDRRCIRDCNVMIVYDDFAAGLRAMDVLTRLSEHHAHDMLFHYNLWQAEDIDRPGADGEAIAEAEEADMILLSLSDCGSLTDNLREWLHQRANHRRERDGAIALMAGANTRPTPGLVELCGVLEALARSADLTFICGADRVRHRFDHEAMRALERRATASSSILDHFLEFHPKVRGLEAHDSPTIRPANHPGPEAIQSG